MQIEQGESSSQKLTTPTPVSRFVDKWECRRCGRWNEFDQYPDCPFCGLNMNSSER